MHYSTAFCASIAAIAIAAPAAAAGENVTFAPQDSQRIDAAKAKSLKEPLDALTKDVGHIHPVAMFVLARRLFDAGRHDEAVFWFYEGQLRWRARIAEDGDQAELAEFDQLFSVVGPDINKYAFGDIPVLLKTLDRALDWDAHHPDLFTASGPAKDASRRGLETLKAYIASHQDEIRKKRAENERLAGSAAKKH